ncbi:MAG: hypothetical protein Q9187_001884 [Circinaria calcarea]
MNCFRVDYCGRGELADRQQKLNQFLSKLAHMAEEFNVCVLMVLNKPLPKSSKVDDRDRPTKSKATPEPTLSSQVQMAVSQSAVISSLTHRRLEFSFGKAVARNAWLRFKILQVIFPSISRPSLAALVGLLLITTTRPDCPEREATYIITSGGIADPEKV